MECRRFGLLTAGGNGVYLWVYYLRNKFCSICSVARGCITCHRLYLVVIKSNQLVFMYFNWPEQTSRSAKSCITAGHLKTSTYSVFA
jgi:hypothetical protein